MKRFLLIPFFLALALVAGVVFIWPKYQSWLVSQEGVKAKEAELKTKRDYYLKIIEITQELQNYQEELVKISSALPKDSSLPQLFGFFQKTASESGLLLKDISASVSASQEEIARGGRTVIPEIPEIGAPSLQLGISQVRELQEIHLNLELEGSYSAFKNFLSEIEKSARLINLKNVSITAGGGEGEGSLALTVQLKTQSY